jgi:hypothetical protein
VAEGVDVGDEDRHRRPVGGDAGTPEHEAVAGIEEGRDLPERGAQVDVLAPGVRQHRAQHREAQRREQCHQAGGRPGAEHQQRGADRLRHGGGFQEHAGADGDAHHEGGGVRECQVAARLKFAVWHPRYRTIRQGAARS